MTLSALTDTQCPPGAARHACQGTVQRGTICSVLARAAPGPEAAAALARHVRADPQFAGSSQEPVELVSWQATAIALVAIAAGVPLGIAAGRVLWWMFATNFGVVLLTVVDALRSLR